MILLWRLQLDNQTVFITCRIKYGIVCYNIYLKKCTTSFNIFIFKKWEIRNKFSDIKGISGAFHSLVSTSVSGHLVLDEHICTAASCSRCLTFFPMYSHDTVGWTMVTAAMSASAIWLGELRNSQGGSQRTMAAC